MNKQLTIRARRPSHLCPVPSFTPTTLLSVCNSLRVSHPGKVSPWKMLSTNMNLQTFSMFQCPSLPLPHPTYSRWCSHLGGHPWLSSLQPQGTPESPIPRAAAPNLVKKQIRHPPPSCTSPVGSFQSLWVYFNKNNMKTWADSFLSKRKNQEQ